MNPYDFQDLSDEQLEAITGGGNIVVNVSPTVNTNPTVVTSVATATSVTTISQVAVVAASNLVNSTVELKAQALTFAQAYNSIG